MSDSEGEKAVGNATFKWGIKKGVGGKKKNIQFYESFTYRGMEYFLYDSVIIYNRSDLETYVGKLVQIYETPSRAKKVKIVWFFRPIEIRNFLNGYKPDVNELFLASGKGEGLSNINPLVTRFSNCFWYVRPLIDVEQYFLFFFLCNKNISLTYTWWMLMLEMKVLGLKWLEKLFCGYSM